MTLTVCIAIAVLIFFGLALFAVRAEENRRVDRRQRNVAVEIERRQGDRRKGSNRAYLKWIFRALWSKIRK
jgi:hypothetical protein